MVLSRAPSLYLHLTHDELQLTLLLHPQWVYDQLPLGASHSNLVNLDTALAEHAVNLELTLTNATLPLSQLMQLQPNDVVLTDHLITTPLQLKQEYQVVARGRLEQAQDHNLLIIEDE